MREWKGYSHGINLGGWYSQCDYSRERLDGFIKEDDIKKISKWGFDHVRLPIDYDVILDENAGLKEEGLARVQRAVVWCQKYGLNVLLDLHKTPGYSFDSKEGESGFFSSERYQKIFYMIWERFASMFAECKDRVAFDLLNEVTEKEFLPAWEKIAAECMKRIRKTCPDTKIVVGSYWYNSVRTVKDLKGPFDNNTVLGFHCYDPQFFTHQRAYWQPMMPQDFVSEYPVSYGKAAAVTKDIYGDGTLFAGYDEKHMISAEFYEKLFKDAVHTAEKMNLPLSCGEYGVIDRADLESTLRWYKDIHTVFRKYGIGHALWSYKEMDFGLSDRRMDLVRDEIISTGKL